MGIYINGKHCYIDLDTGEYLETDGGVFHSNKDMQNIKRAKERERRKKLRRNLNDEYGGFVLIRKAGYKITPQTLGRLAYLSVYTEYKTGCLMKSQRLPMKFDDIKNVLKISKQATYNFLNEVQKENLLSVNEQGEYVLSNYFIKGQTKFRKKIRLFIDPAKSLYEKLINDKLSIKYFGYVIKLLPYINKEWNVVCHNPEEKNPYRLEPMTIEEICSLLKFNSTNNGRLTRILRNIKFIAYDPFENKRVEQRLCNFIKDLNSNTWRMIINPNILFMGVDPTKIEGYLQFFPSKTSNNE